MSVNKYNIGDIVNGHLILNFISNDGRNKVMLFRCGLCGSEFEKNVYVISSGATKSCGCKYAEVIAKRTTHGQAKIGKLTDTYRAWRSIKGRCLNPKNQKYHRYGGRGVKIYEGWVNNYQAFYDYIGDRPSPDMTVGRIDNDGHYEPGNVRWETGDEQANNKSSNVLIEYKGKTKTLNQWCVELGLKYSVVYSRYVTYGKTAEEAFQKQDRRTVRVINRDSVTGRIIKNS